ncbi:unnamed protein product [Paramecium pentaurelia]|uniref:Uncharacterized protein n=1 Tax=Paramecium pentaurelia TaxID=43138 RepID=A0A8S1YKI4_9CILI|nr:unnamed protein product [Paramecium pentaurelia]
MEHYAEQCDLYDKRGVGQYSVIQKYSCGSRLENKKKTITIRFVSIWTLVSMLTSVQSNLKQSKKWQIAMESNMEQNIDRIPLSLRSPAQAKERQQFIRKSV